MTGVTADNNMKRDGNMKIFLFFLAMLFLLGCTEYSKPKVAVTLYPYGHMAEMIGRDRIEVVYLIPEGASEHVSEPNPSKLIEAHGSDLIIYNGIIDEWALQVDGRKKLRMYDYVAEGNPHIWLDPVLMEALAIEVRDALIDIDPDGKVDYEANTESYIKELRSLDAYAKQKIKPKKVLEMHPGFTRFGERYGLDIIPVERVEGEEVSGARLAELIDMAKEENIDTFIVEHYRNPSEAESIASEIGARVVVLYSMPWIGKEDKEQGKDYFYIMRSNIDLLSE